MDFPSIGNMRRRLTVQFKTETADGAGGYTRTWDTQETVWGNIEPMSGNKVLIGGELSAVVTHKIYIRYRSDITTQNRIVYGSRTFQIHAAIIIQEKQRYLQLSCQEGVGS